MAECICAGDSCDTVDKINWKCVECKRDLKPDCEKKWVANKAAQAEAQAAAKATLPGQLTEEQIADRRAMAQVK